MTQYYGGQNLTPETPIYLVVYHIMGTSYSGFPVFSIVKVYACEFQDFDNLWTNHAGVPQNNQAIVFYREPANPFQGVAVNMGNPFGSPLEMEYPTVSITIPISSEIRDASGKVVGWEAKLTPWSTLENMPVQGTPETNVAPINWGPDPFLPEDDNGVDSPREPDDNVWNM